VDDSQLFQLKRQPMTQRALGSQFVQQLFRSVERGRADLSALKNVAPTARYLLFG